MGGCRSTFDALAPRWVQLGKVGNLAVIEGIAERIPAKPVRPVSSAGGGPVEFKAIIEEIGN